MEKTSMFEYYAFGYDYGLIKRSGLKGYKLPDAKIALSDFLYSLKDLNLPVTKKISERLCEIYEDIKSLDESNLPDEFAKKIKAEIDKIDPALDAELQLKEIFVLTEKRYSLNFLLNEPKKLLGKGVFQKLTETSQTDFSSACTQIALSQPTASAFHLMRALEEQVKVLYFAFKKTKKLDKPMWGAMTAQLKEKKAPKPSAKLLSHLDGMRNHFRNPTQHPEMFYSIDEAQDLLNQTITAINMIHSELPKKS